MLGRQGNTRLTISPHGEQCQSARSALACVSEAPFKLEQEDYIASFLQYKSLDCMTGINKHALTGGVNRKKSS